MKKIIYSLTALLFSVGMTQAQDSTSVTNISDKLGFTKSSRAIYKGTLLTGFDLGYSEFKINPGQGNKYHSNDISLPSVSIGYGISKNIDIHFSTNFSHSSWGNTTNGNYMSGSKYRLRGFSIGSKVNLFKQKGWIPEVAFDLNVGFPSNFELIQTNLNGALALSYNIGEKLRLGGSLYMNSVFYDAYDKVNVSNTFGYSLNVRYEFLKGIGAFVDVDVNRFRSSTFVPNGGLYYRINPNMQIQISTGKLVYRGYNPTEFGYVSGGFTWLLFNK